MLKKILTICAITLLFAISAPQKISAAETKTTGADPAVCTLDNKEACDTADTATVIGDSGHTDSCDKTLYLFYGKECPHCQELEAYLADIQKNHPEIELKKYEVWHSSDNLALLQKMAKDRGVEAKNVPILFVGHQTFIGYASDQLTGPEIKKSIFDLYCIKEDVKEGNINIPFFGSITVSSLSLPALTVVLGLIDGFNPCAMWALFALITVLIATKDKKKIRLVGSIFIISSWLIYFLFMALYLNTFKLLAFVSWIRYAIGAIAIIAGFFYLRDFKNYQPGVCKVTNQKQQKSIIDRMKNVTSKNSIILIILGVIALAVSVNMIEMICSLGLPVVYTQILSLANLPTWQYYLYLAAYNTLYMADDITVFLIAAITLNYVHLNHKYDKWMKLVGGVLVLALGLVLILRPSLLS